MAQSVIGIDPHKSFPLESPVNLCIWCLLPGCCQYIRSIQYERCRGAYREGVSLTTADAIVTCQADYCLYQQMALVSDKPMVLVSHNTLILDPISQEA